ncbi:MAG: hypothetical protein ACRDDQ_07820, partial [Cetobacterium sp.]
MKKYRLLLLLLALHGTKVFSQDKGLIFWSDFMYFKNQEEDYYLLQNMYCINLAKGQNCTGERIWQ